MNQRKAVICGQNLDDHSFKFEADGRSLTCEKCGVGFVVQPHKTREEGNFLVVESGKGDLRIPLNK